MRIFDALSVEGTCHFSVLCYGIFPLSKIDAAHSFLEQNGNQPESKVYKLLADQWTNGVLLIEVLVAVEARILTVISSTLSKMFDAGSCLSALCMYDGAFLSYDDLFSENVADQIYAFGFLKDQYVVNLDADILSSREWTSVIALCRKRLG